MNLHGVPRMTMDVGTVLVLQVIGDEIQLTKYLLDEEDES